MTSFISPGFNNSGRLVGDSESDQRTGNIASLFSDSQCNLFQDFVFSEDADGFLNGQRRRRMPVARHGGRLEHRVVGRFFGRLDHRLEEW
jgi:hypothetical protein